MAEVTSSRNVTIVKLIDSTGNRLADLARWPDSEATQLAADNAIKLLKKALKESAYPHSFTYMAMVQVAFTLYTDTVNREHVTTENLKRAWIKVADIL